MSLARKWEGTKAGEVLWLAYQMTQKHGQQCPNEVQQLWNTIASKADNVAVVVDFVIQRSTEELGVESNCRLMVWHLDQSCLLNTGVAIDSNAPIPGGSGRFLVTFMISMACRIPWMCRSGFCCSAVTKTHNLWWMNLCQSAHS